MNFYDVLLAKQLGGGGGATPTGTLSINSNGLFDVAQYASADVVVSDANTELKKLVTGTITSFNMKVVSSDTAFHSYAFYQCKSLKNVKVDTDGYGRSFDIGSNTFNGCSALETVDLGWRVQSLNANAFNGCSSMKSLTLRFTDYPVSVSVSSAISGLPADCIIYVPSAKVDSYKSSSAWSARADYIRAIEE